MGMIGVAGMNAGTDGREWRPILRSEKWKDG